VKDEVIPHVLVAEEEVGVTPEAGHQGTLQNDIANKFLLTPQFWRSIPCKYLPQGASFRHCGQVICEQAVVFVSEGELSCWSESWDLES